MSPYTGPLFRRRGVLLAATTIGADLASPRLAFPAMAADLAASFITDIPQGDNIMGYVTTNDGVEIFYKDWGPKDAQPVVFHHGWPLSSDDWDAQMLFFLSKGYRVVAHDRRGHGRSEQVHSVLNSTEKSPGTARFSKWYPAP